MTLIPLNHNMNNSDALSAEYQNILGLSGIYGALVSRYYFDFNDNAFVATGNQNWTLTGAASFKWRVKFTWQAAASTRKMFTLGGSEENRLLTAGSNFQFRQGGGATISTSGFITADIPYEAIITDAAGDGNITISIVNLNTGVEATSGSGATGAPTSLTGRELVIGANAGKSNSFWPGRIWDFIMEMPIGTQIYKWAINDNDTTIIESIAGRNGTLTVGSGVWETDTPI